MKRRLHLLAALVATATIATFLSATLLVELFGSAASVARVKGLIVSPGLFILIPALAITGGSGFALGKSRADALTRHKQRRMPFIALNGLLILLPAALFLDTRAAAGLFDAGFYAVQGIELLAGALNLTLMGLNARDGLRLSRGHAA